MPDGHPPLTIADLIAQLATDPGLADKRRRDLRSDLASFCRGIAMPPQACPLTPGFLRQHLFGLHERQLRISRKRLLNIRASLRWCVRRYVQPQTRLSWHLGESWAALERTLPAPWGRRPLRRFMCYCSEQAIAPEEVSAAVLAGFRQYLEAGLAVMTIPGYITNVIYAWNKAAAEIPGWPQNRITRVPDNAYSLPWSAFPASLRAETERWLGAQAGSDPLDDLAQERPLEPCTLKGLENHVRAMASILVQRGVPATAIDGLAVLVDNAKEILRFCLARTGNRPSPIAGARANTLVLIAAGWLKRPGPELEMLRGLRRRVSVGQRGMTKKNRLRLHQFDSNRNKLLLLRLPAELMGAAQNGRADDWATALKALAAVAIELLLTTMVRPQNLRSIALDQHFLNLSDSPRRRQYLVFGADEVKNDVDLEFEIGTECARLLRLYLAKFHPTLGGGRFLFPSRTGDRPKALSNLAKNINQAVFTHTGLKVNPHLFRHIGAKLYLDEHPGAYEVVRCMLGHKDIATTIRFYAGMELPQAVAQFDTHVIKLRRTLRP